MTGFSFEHLTTTTKIEFNVEILIKANKKIKKRF